MIAIKVATSLLLVATRVSLLHPFLLGNCNGADNSSAAGAILGAICTQDSECASDYCSDGGRCQCNFNTPVSDGCNDTTEVCIFDWPAAGYVCESNGLPGSPCTSDDNCSNLTVFTPNRCSSGFCGCDTYSSAICPSSLVCETNTSSGQPECVNPGSSLSIYSKCRTDSQCASGTCYAPPRRSHGLCKCNVADNVGCPEGEICYMFPNGGGPSCGALHGANCTAPWGCVSEEDWCVDGKCQCQPGSCGFDAQYCVRNESGVSFCDAAGPPGSRCEANSDCHSVPSFAGSCNKNGRCRCDPTLIEGLCGDFRHVCRDDGTGTYTCENPGFYEVDIGHQCRFHAQCKSNFCSPVTGPDETPDSLSFAVCAACNVSTNEGCEDRHNSQCYLPQFTSSPAASSVCVTNVGSHSYCTNDTDCFAENCHKGRCQCNPEVSPVTGETNLGCESSQTCTASGSDFVCTGDVSTSLSSSCFSGNSVVEVLSKDEGMVKDIRMVNMKDLAIGDVVKTSSNAYEPIYAFGHKSHTHVAHFLQIILEDNATHHDDDPPPLEISGDHMVALNKNNGGTFVPSSSLKVKDELLLGNGNVATIKSIHKVIRQGLYAPFTESGTIVVNGVLASNYISYQESAFLMIGGVETRFSYHWLAHLFNSVHRLLLAGVVGGWSMMIDEEVSYDADTGISNWVYGPHKLFSSWLLLNQHAAIQVVVLLPVVSLLVLVSWFELLLKARSSSYYYCAVGGGIMVTIIGLGVCWLLGNRRAVVLMSSRSVRKAML